MIKDTSEEWTSVRLHLTAPLNGRTYVEPFALRHDGFGGYIANLSPTRRLRIPREMVVAVEDVKAGSDDAGARSLWQRMRIAVYSAAGVAAFWLTWALVLRAHM